MSPKLRIPAAMALMAATLLVSAGCGDDGPSEQEVKDREEITALVEEINRVTAEKDAQGFCAIIQPSGVEETFNTQATCVRETEQILQQDAAEQPRLEILDIAIDGDQATVDLESNAGGAPINLVREGGKWYIPLSSSEIETETETGPETDSPSE